MEGRPFPRYRPVGHRPARRVGDQRGTAHQEADAAVPGDYADGVRRRQPRQALCNGASGYLLKQTPLQKIKEAVESLHEGGAPMSPGIPRKVVEYFNPKDTDDLQEQLTPREAQVVEAIEEGLTNKEVAIRLDISLETVKYHIKNIYEKLQVNSRHALISRKYK